MEQWSDGRSEGMAQLSRWLIGSRNLRSAKSSESALNSGIPVYSIFTHTSDFFQTQNEAKILTAAMTMRRSMKPILHVRFEIIYTVIGVMQKMSQKNYITLLVGLIVKLDCIEVAL